MRRAVFALALALAAGGAHAADSIKGRTLYQAHCASCHGATGRAVLPGAPNFDQGDGMMRPDITILMAIRAGKNAMPAFQGRLEDRDIMDVIAYIRTLH
ncbi:MAG TPA: c-type cytochrome [Telluria sp.]|jgi:cytochrome c6|nr:c-type cytochrome [Telluria sp.]